MAREYDANHLIQRLTLTQLRRAIVRYDAGNLPDFRLRKPTAWHLIYEGHPYPVKNLCAMAIGSRPGSFNTHYAVNRLEKLGVECWPLDPNSISTEGEQERERLKRLGEVACRPGQSGFSSRLREIYNHTCAITGCKSAEALQAAHIRVQSGRDDNRTTNGILLRADVHALFDAGRISLTPDGKRVEFAADWTDSTYSSLKRVKVFRPKVLAPSLNNIAWHRTTFGF